MVDGQIGTPGETAMCHVVVDHKYATAPVPILLLVWMAVIVKEAVHRNHNYAIQTSVVSRPTI